VSVLHVCGTDGDGDGDAIHTNGRGEGRTNFTYGNASNSSHVQLCTCSVGKRAYCSVSQLYFVLSIIHGGSFRNLHRHQGRLRVWSDLIVT